MKKTIALALAIITVLMLALSLASCGTNSPEGLTKAAIKAYLKPDSKKFASYQLYSVEDYLEYIAKEKGMTVEEFLEENLKCSSLDEYFKEEDEETADEMEDEYGEFDYEIRDVKVDEYTSKELKELKEDIDASMESKYLGIDSGKIDTAADCEVKVRIKGEEKSETLTVELTVVKYDGKWKIYDFDM